jgi:hypothetical protein
MGFPFAVFPSTAVILSVLILVAPEGHARMKEQYQAHPTTKREGNPGNHRYKATSCGEYFVRACHHVLDWWGMNPSH